MLLGDRPVFLHGEFVRPVSNDFDVLLGNNKFGQENRYAQPLHQLPYPDAFMGLLEWMYTRRIGSLLDQSGFWEVYQLAEYLGMASEFIDELHTKFVSLWCTSLDERLFLVDALITLEVPFAALQRVSRMPRQIASQCRVMRVFAL